MPQASMRRSTSPVAGSPRWTGSTVTAPRAAGRIAALLLVALICLAHPLEEVIELALVGKGGEVAVAGNYLRLSGKGQELVVDRLQNLPAIAARQVGSADAFAEQRVAGDQLASPGIHRQMLP